MRLDPFPQMEQIVAVGLEFRNPLILTGSAYDPTTRGVESVNDVLQASALLRVRDAP